MENLKSIYWVVMAAFSSWVGYIHMSRPSKGECYARHQGIDQRFDDLKDHIDTRFNDIKELIKKNGRKK